MIKRSILVASVLALVGTACTSDGGSEPTPAPQTGTPPPTASATPPPALDAIPVSAVLFGELADVPLLDPDDPPYAGPATPTTLAGVAVADTVREAIADPTVSSLLEANGFAIVPADLRLFHFAYQGNLYEGWPVFVTTDVAYHVWHQVFDKVLRGLEQEVLLPELEALVAGLLEDAAAQTQELAGTPLADAASRVEQLVQVAAAELGMPVTLGPLAEQELALIEAHTATERSPIVDVETDYSLFTPRGHYTRTEDLTRYFLGMSVLGQLAFCLPGTTGCPGLEPTRQAILVSRVLLADAGLAARWRRIYEPTAFFVGLGDDYAPDEVAKAADAVGPGLSDATAYADDALVQAVAEELRTSRPVRINPDRASVRVMGTRFVIDSFVFDQLITPNVGTPDDPRTLPTALDLAAAFGSEFAHATLEGLGETHYENYESQLARMQELIAARPAPEWGSTVYDAWLHALEPSFVAHGEAFPDFMRTVAWATKAHQSAFGSYAELKHDTILYAKQAVAEGGDGAPIPERRNWVEPDPVVFGRLAAMADLTRAGLDERDLLTDEHASLLRDAADLFGFLDRIARDELAGAPISESDNQRLTNIGGELEFFWFRTSDQAATGEPETDEDAAIVADVASDATNVLEVGTGRIDRIYVLVPDDEGGFQVAVGGVYSYYEFPQPAGERLTDELWRAMLDAGDQPPRPGWQSILFEV
jgi:hypothetical protein